MGAYTEPLLRPFGSIDLRISMLNHFATTWRENRGNLLLMVSAAAGVFVSLIWYTDVIPEIGFVRANTENSTTAVPQSSFLVATIATPNWFKPNLANAAQLPTQQNEGDPSAPSQATAGYILVIPPVGNISADMTVIASREFVPLESNVQALVISGLPAGNYAAIAFLDINGNRLLDFGADELPLEPTRIGTLSNAEQDIDLSQVSDLSEVGFVLRPARPTSLKFDFQ